MARPTEHVLDGGDTPLTWVETPANGPPLVFLHGLGARWQVFGPLISRLAADWHIFAMDFRGHGTSGRTPGDYELTGFNADATLLLEECVGEPAVVYGHSLGGWVTLSVAAASPGAVRAAVVADTAIYPGDMDPDFALSYLANLPLALRSLAKSLKQLDPEVLERLRSGTLTAGFDADAVLPQVRCPVLLLQGDPKEEALMLDSDVEQSLALLPDARHVAFPGLGHGLHVEDAEAVLDAFRAFTTEVGVASPAR